MRSHQARTRRTPLSREEWQREKVQARALRASLDRATAVKVKVESYVAEKKTETQSMVFDGDDGSGSTSCGIQDGDGSRQGRTRRRRTGTAQGAVHDVARPGRDREGSRGVGQAATAVGPASNSFRRLPKEPCRRPHPRNCRWGDGSAARPGVVCRAPRRRRRQASSTPPCCVRGRVRTFASNASMPSARAPRCSSIGTTVANTSF